MTNKFINALKAMPDNKIVLVDLVEKCDYVTKLALTAWVFEKIIENAKIGGSFRYLIYDLLKFDMDAYVPLYESGGMEITNNFDMQHLEQIKKIVKEEKISSLKRILSLCDEQDCFDKACCGFPSEEGYRFTCQSHRKNK